MREFRSLERSLELGIRCPVSTLESIRSTWPSLDENPSDLNENGDRERCLLRGGDKFLCDS